MIQITEDIAISESDIHVKFVRFHRTGRTKRQQSVNRRSTPI